MCSDERLCFQHKNMNWNRYYATRIVDTRLCGTHFWRYHEVSMTRQTHRPLGSKELHVFPIDHFQSSIGNKRNILFSQLHLFEISFSPCFIRSLSLPFPNSSFPNSPPTLLYGLARIVRHTFCFLQAEAWYVPQQMR